MSKTERESGFELLRIISIILIVSMHAMAPAFKTSNIVNRELIIAINSISNIGVSLFILISGYYGIRFRLEKLIKFIGLVWFYNIINFCNDFFLLEKPIDVKEYISYLFPILSCKYWFITCYLILFCFSKWINMMCEKLSNKELKRIIVIATLFFVIAPTMLIFHEITNDLGKGIINMSLIYIIGQYIRLHGFPHIIKDKYIYIIICSYVISFIANSALSEYCNTIVLRFARDNNLFILLLAISVFYVFSIIKWKNKIINHMATFVFPLYLIHLSVLSLTNSYLSYNINDYSLWQHIGCGIIISIIACILIEAIRRAMMSRLNSTHYISMTINKHLHNH